MSSYIVQAIFQGVSLLPKDEFENIFHFVGSDGPATRADAGSAIARVLDFYQGGGPALVSFMGSVTQTITIKVYDEAAEKPRPVLQMATAPISTTSSAQLVPPEVALCLSYYSTTNVNGRRGRIYFGPMQASVLTEGSSGSEAHQSRPTSAVMSSLLAAGVRLATDNDGAEPDRTALTFFPVYEAPFTYNPACNWALRTTKGGVVYRLIDHLWVDNEWDGQSRRRVEATARISAP